MKGAGTSYTSDPAKKQAWLNEIESRQEISSDQLIGLFSSDFIKRIDLEQTERFIESPGEFVGFVTLKGATKDEERLFNLARRNTATYDEEGEDLMFEDLIIAKMTDPQIRNHFRSSEEFSEAIRLRRTVVAHFLVAMELIDHTTSISGSDKGAA